MLGPFATASRRTPHCHSPGVATVARRLRIDVHNNDDDDNNDNAWQRGPLWPHRMGPIILLAVFHFGHQTETIKLNEAAASSVPLRLSLAWRAIGRAGYYARLCHAVSCFAGRAARLQQRSRSLGAATHTWSLVLLIDCSLRFNKNEIAW